MRVRPACVAEVEGKTLHRLGKLKCIGERVRRPWQHVAWCVQIAGEFGLRAYGDWYVEHCDLSQSILGRKRTR